MASTTRLRRDLGLIDVFAISTGAMFSSGFFLLPGIAFHYAGAWMVLAYVLSAILVVPAMVSMAELASALPRAGGTYYYLDRSMGPLVGTIGGLGTWIAMGLKNTFALIGIGVYVALFLDLPVTPVAVALALVFTGVNIVGTKETARLQRWLVYALLSILGVFLVFGYGALAADGSTSIRDQLALAPSTDVDGLLATVGLVFVSYAGLTKVASVAEEVQRPDRNILLGMGLSLGVATAFYGLGTLLLVLVVPHAQLENDLTPLATGADIVFSWLPGRLGALLISLAAVAAFASTANAGIMSASRYLLAMGRDRLIGSAFQRIGRFKTPTLAVLATGAFVVTALLTLDVISIAKLASAFQLLMFALVNVAVIVMRESRIETYDPAVRSPMYPWTQLVGIFFSLALIVEMGRTPMLFTLALVGLSAGWYFVYGNTRTVRRGAILHWFERLGRERFDALETEMWTILKESGLRPSDPYDTMVNQAPILDIVEPMPFTEVAQAAARRLSPHVDAEDRAVADAFVRGVREGLTPVRNGVAMTHFMLPGQTDHRLLMVRSRGGVTIDPDGEADTGDEVHALFFLVSPQADVGQHLRLVAQLVTQVDEADFRSAWFEGAGVGDLRRLMLDDVLTRLARQLTERLRNGGATGWRPRAAAGRFESLVVVDPKGEVLPEVAAWAEDLATLHDANVTLLRPMRWLQVVQHILRHEHDLLMVQEQRTSPGLSSFTQHVLRKSPCPVWVVRTARPLTCRRVLAAIDATATDPTHRALNLQILAYASALTEQLGAQLHLVHAWSEVGAEPLIEAGVLDEAEPVDWHHAYGKLVDELLRGHRIDPATTRIHLVEGTATEVISEIATREEIDLVILGTVCRTGVAGMLIGNTAEGVIQRVGCGVLAVKPVGFVTPVTLEPER